VASVDKRVPAPQIRLAKPLYRRNPPPDYPKRARRKGMEGIVILEILVDEKGGVEDITLFKSSGHKILDKAARASVKSWLFQPGTRDGQNIKMWVQVPIRFKLN
jgi:protein TonB